MKTFIVSFCLILVLGCQQPTSFHNSVLSNQSPEEVVQNLILAYTERNIDRYMSSFSEDSKFSDGGNFLWGKKLEEEIHQKMFATAKSIGLQIVELVTDNYTKSNKTAIYHYFLELEFSTEQILQARGQLELGFTKNEFNNWQINSFRDIEGGLNKSSKIEFNTSVNPDSIDYFPLRVGNQWTYQDRINPSLPDFETNVTDSVIIRDNLYFHLDSFPFVTNAFYRVNSLQQLNLFVPSDSSELTIYKFTAAIGDSWTLHLPNDPDSMTVELISQKDSLAVSAGTFTNILEFLITDFNSGARFFCEFAPSIGLVRQRGENQELALKGACINGQKYPIITDVEIHYFSWTQIKKSFNL